MTLIRPATPADLALITATHAAQVTYEKAVADQLSDKSKTRKYKLGRPPRRCQLVLGPESAEGVQMVYEVIEEPENQIMADSKTQKVVVFCSAVADNARFTCLGNNESITFLPTYMLQSLRHTISFKNDSDVSMPLSWSLKDMNTKSPQPNSASVSRSGVRTPTYGSTSSLYFPLIPLITRLDIDRPHHLALADRLGLPRLRAISDHLLREIVREASEAANPPLEVEKMKRRGRKRGAQKRNMVTAAMMDVEAVEG